jgi:hypothetical protein
MAKHKNTNGRDFLRWLAQRFVVDQPLEPDSQLYQPIYENDPSDPIELIFRDIDFAEVESLNFISGFRGAGKTTELFRLRKMLRDAGHFLPAEPVEISDFLMVLAGSFSEAVEQELAFDPAREGWWRRLVNWLSTTNVDLNAIEAKANVPGTDVGLNFKTALKEVPSFRRRIREQMAPRIGELRAEVRKFFADTLKRIKEKTGTPRNAVFLFDQLEQLRDTFSTGGSVADSVVTMFANHRRDFQIPSMHMVMTVPPWLKFTLPDAKKIRLLYNVKLWNNDPKRSRHKPGWKAINDLLQRRLTADGARRYFGDMKKDSLADRLIEASGGHFRDLIILVRETLLRADPDTLPVHQEAVDAAVASYRDTFLPIPLADAAWLHAIGIDRDSLLKDRTTDSVQRMTFFLDTHGALILKNGAEWYDVHPIIRDEIAEIVKREAKAAAT